MAQILHGKITKKVITDHKGDPEYYEVEIEILDGPLAGHLLITDIPVVAYDLTEIPGEGY